MATIEPKKIALNVNLHSTVKGYLPLSWRNLNGFSFSVRGVIKKTNNNYEPYTGRLISSTTNYTEIYGNSYFLVKTLQWKYGDKDF